MITNIWKVDSSLQKTSLNYQITHDWLSPLPSAPILGPHFGRAVRIWGELITVKSIAGVNL